jgi:hypothetical protein
MTVGTSPFPIPDRPPQIRLGGEGGNDSGQATDGGRGRGRGYHIVAVDEPLRADELNADWWVLVLANERPAAFLSPAAAMEAADAGLVIDYLRRRRAGYMADLTDHDDVFNRYLSPIDTEEALVVFDHAVIGMLAVKLQDSFELMYSYCERGYDPEPGTRCPGCTCRLKRIGR